jgi:hypothetical protein
LEDEAREAEAKAKKKDKAKKAKALKAARPKTPLLDPTPELEEGILADGGPQGAESDAPPVSANRKHSPCKACAALQRDGTCSTRCILHAGSAGLSSPHAESAARQRSPSPSRASGSDTTSDAGSILDLTTAVSDDGWELIGGRGRRRSMTGSRKATQAIQSDCSASPTSTPARTRPSSPVSVCNGTAPAGRTLAVPVTQAAGARGVPAPWGPARQATEVRPWLPR